MFSIGKYRTSTRGLITGGELIRRAYRELTKGSAEIKLPDVYVLVSDHSDEHRTNQGFMRYDSANLLQFDRVTWAVARGESCGDYPARAYNSDISAVIVSARLATREVEKEVIMRLEESVFFRNSLLYAMTDGVLATGCSSYFVTSTFNGKVRKMLRAVLPSYQVERGTGDIRDEFMYKPGKNPEFAVHIAKAMELALRDSSRADIAVVAG